MKLEVDRTGFPMVPVESIGAYVSWLPLTKLQLELFLCETIDDHFGPRWYDGILSLNPRIVSAELTTSNYWRAFSTGLLPREVRSYLRWLGDGYQIPTVKEWQAMLKEFDRRDPRRFDWPSTLPESKPRVIELLQSIDRLAVEIRPRSMAEQMLLVGGVLEWVAIQDYGYRWGGMGEVPPGLGGLLFDPWEGKAHRPLHPENERIDYFGLRPMRREAL